MANEEKSSLNDIIQYPTRRLPAPSSTPNPISKQFPKIATPNETELKFTESDWKMFDKIRAKYGDRLNVLYPDDLTRFVQGYAHEEKRDTATFQRIDELLKRGFSPNTHKNQYDFRNILKVPMQDNEEEESLKAWPVFMYGYDNQGHPVMYDCIGCSNPKDLDACFDNKLRKLKTFRFRVMRRLHNTKRIQTMRYGYDGSVNDKGGFNAITKQVIVMDMKNFYAKCLTAKYRNLIQDITGDESNLWPNTLEKMYIINAPWPFRFAWKIVSNFVHPITVAKIEILGSDYIKSMKKKISLDQIPKEYGGTCELPIKYGYTADIDNDILDGDYTEQGDPLDLDTVDCIKNKDKKQKKEEKNNDNDKKGGDNDDDEEYVKVKDVKNNSEEKPKSDALYPPRD